jgi:chitinase
MSKEIKEQKKSAELIAFEEKHGEGNVKVVELKSAKGTTTVHIKVPKKDALFAYQVWIDKDAGKANKLIMDKCLLDKHDELNADDEMYVACGIAIANMMPIGSFEVKN